MRAIGIDIGTTSVSGVMLERKSGADTEPRLLYSETVPGGADLASDREWEKTQDPAVIIAKARDLLDRLVARGGEPDCIGLTGQMHGIVYVDAEGNAVSPLYTWQDQRGGLREGGLSVVERAAAARTASGQAAGAGSGPEAGAERTTAAKGSAGVAAGYGLVTHIYNVEHGLVPEKAVSFCTIADYFGMRLTGRRAPLVHVNDAASYGFWDLAGERFDREMLLRVCPGAEREVFPFLPEVTAENALLGEYRGIPVAAAIGDNQASFLGAAGSKEHTLLINVGTGGQVSMAGPAGMGTAGKATAAKAPLDGRSTAAKATPDGETCGPLLTEIRPYIDHRCLMVGATLCGGRAYAILERFFRLYNKEMTGRDVPQYEVMERMAREELARLGLSPAEAAGTASAGAGPAGESFAPEGLPHALTTFSGTRADPGARGSITGLTEDNFLPGRLVLSIMTGMIGEMKSLYDEMLRIGGEPAKRAVVSGNGMRRNALLREIAAGMFGMPVSLSPCEEEAASGAALYALKCLSRM